MAVFSFVIVLIFVSGRSSARADDADQVCNAGVQKIWYIALGKEVFALPYDQFFDETGGPLVNDLNAKLALAPPNPTAPVGCRDNPQQITSFAVLDSPVLEPENYSGPMPRSIYKLEMYRYPGSNVTGPGMDPMIENIIDIGIGCQTKKYIRRWDNGTILCTNTNDQLNPLLNNQNDYIAESWEFIVSGNLYLTPLGRNLVEKEFVNGIDVVYLLSPDILVHYEWIPPKSAQVINSSYLIDLDRLFLSKMLSYEIDKYQWSK